MRRSISYITSLAVDIFHTAKERNIEIEVEWMPRSTRKVITWAGLSTFITAQLKSVFSHLGSLLSRTPSRKNLVQEF